MQTYAELIADCVSEALCLPRSPIQTEIRDLALSVANDKARLIWDSWPFDNEKLDEFTAPAPVSGVITFAATVDVVRALKVLDANGDVQEGTRIWNEDELIAAAQGAQVSSDRFQHLADGVGGLRRVRVAVDTSKDADTWRALALARYVPAVVDAAYDSTDPTATPTDYRVLNFVLDRAEPALKAFVKDALRGFSGIPRERDGADLLQLAVRREQYDADRERRVNPRYPMFGDE